MEPLPVELIVISEIEGGPIIQRQCTVLPTYGSEETEKQLILNLAFSLFLPQTSIIVQGSGGWTLQASRGVTINHVAPALVCLKDLNNMVLQEEECPQATRPQVLPC